MQAHGQTTVWGTDIGLGGVRDARRWYRQLKEWWRARKAMRREARLAALAACWDAKREALRPLKAEAAHEMIAAAHTFSTATALYGLAL